MGDSDQKKSSVPAWETDLKKATPTEGDTEPQPPSRDALIEQAKKFLEEDEVRNASTDKKISFLEGKGLSSEEIQSLIGVARLPEASSTPASSTNPSTSLEQRPKYSIPPPRDTPPVIAYPEFLTKPPHPTPLVTTSRLRTTLYFFSALSAVLYGTNNYLVTPMLTSLTQSRLSLAETASSNLAKLISKLEAAVSELPPQKAHLEAGRKGYDDKDEEDTDDEDPTEMFHRDIGIQTSTPSSPILSSAIQSTTTDSLTAQETQLKSLSSSISTLLETSSSEGQETSDLTTAVAVLRDYLDGLSYVPPTYSYGMGGYGGMAQNSSAGKEDDEIAKVKLSIRAVKGVMLSTRSFPRTVR